MGECKEFAGIFARIYQSNKEDTEWPPSSRKLEYFSQVHEYQVIWDSIQDVIRSSTTMVCAEDAINPMKQSVSELAPSIDAEKKERHSMLTDYDSYRRRLKTLEQKRDAAEVKIFLQIHMSNEIKHNIQCFFILCSQMEKVVLKKQLKY